MVTMVCCWRMLQWFSIDNITGYLQWKTRQHCREQSDSHWWSTLRFTPKHSLWKIHPRHSNIKNTCHKGSFQALSTSLKGLAKALSTKGLAKALSNYPPTPPYPHTQNNKNKTLNKFNKGSNWIWTQPYRHESSTVTHQKLMYGTLTYPQTLPTKANYQLPKALSAIPKNSPQRLITQGTLS